MERLPVTLEIAGQPTTFTPENTECRVYRKSEWDAYNHTQILEYGSQYKRIFRAPRLIMYLTGIELDYIGIENEDIETLVTAMDEEFGWNARLVVEDEPNEHVQKRFITAMAPELIKPELYIPTGWE